MTRGAREAERCDAPRSTLSAWLVQAKAADTSGARARTLVVIVLVLELRQIDLAAAATGQVLDHAQRCSG